MTKKALKKQLKKQLKKSVKQAAKNKKAIKLLKKQLSAFESKSMSYLERLCMSNVDYPIDDFGAIAYVDASSLKYSLECPLTFLNVILIFSLCFITNCLYHSSILVLVTE